MLASLAVWVARALVSPALANPPRCDQALPDIIARLKEKKKYAPAPAEQVPGRAISKKMVDVGDVAHADDSVSIGKATDPNAKVKIGGAEVEIPMRPYEYKGPPIGAKPEDWAAQHLQVKIPGIKSDDLKLLGTELDSVGGTRWVFAHPTDSKKVIKVYDPALKKNNRKWIAAMIRRERDGRKILEEARIKFAAIDDDPELLARGIVIQDKALGEPVGTFSASEFPEIEDFYSKVDGIDDELRRLSNDPTSKGGFEVKLWGVRPVLKNGKPEMTATGEPVVELFQHGFDKPKVNCHYDPPPPRGTGTGVVCFDF